MFPPGAILTWAPAFSTALPLARERWRERGGLLVVPRREDAARALAEAVAGGPAALGREAVTFAGLRGRVALAAGVREDEPPSAVAVRLALRAVLDDADLSAFGASADAPGFLAAVERAVAELRAARVAPARAAAAAGTPVARAVAAIHAAAWDAVPMPSDALWAAAGAARAVARFPPVTVTGFDDLVPGQWALLHALAQTTRVEVVMPFDAGRPAFEARRARQGRWAAEAGSTRTEGALAETGSAGLAARLFDAVPPAPDPPPLRLVGAAGTRGMLRAALDEALAAVDRGTAMDRVALVVPRLAEVRDDLERLIGDWGVPARMSSRVRVLEAPLALALTHLLRLGELDPGAPGALDHLLGWLRTPYSGADQAEVDRFEADMRRAGVATRGPLLSRWEGVAAAPARRLVAAAGQGPRSQLAAMVEAGWQALRRAGDAAALPGRADLRDRAALMALAGLAAAVDEAGAAAGDDDAPPRARGPVPPGAVGELIADLTVLAREEPPGGLEVHDLASLRGRGYDAVVIAGLDGDGYPPGPAADPLLGDLRGPLADVLPERAPGTSEGRLRFVHAVDAARAELVLVRRTVDDEGREVAPSPYWLEACRLAGRDPGELDRAAGARGEVPDAADAARSEREALRAMALDGLVAPGPLAEAAARRSRPVGVAPDAFRHRTHLRVTELESYLRCPYGWFRDSVLAPAELEELIDPRFEGTVAHEALHAVYAAMAEARIGPCTTATLDAYRGALDAELPAVCGRMRPAAGGASFDALQERLRRHLRALLGREAALGSALVPTHFERRLESAALAPGAVVTGAVDRLDIAPEGGAALVVDYKRSGADFNPSSQDVVRRLQLPLYGELAREVLGAEPAGGLYMGMLSAKVAGAVCDDVPGAPDAGRAVVPREVWERITAEALEAARAAVDGIRAGRLDPPEPDSCSHWCRCEDLWR
jgi:RecB family exonuclease